MFNSNLWRERISCLLLTASASWIFNCLLNLHLLQCYLVEANNSYSDSQSLKICYRYLKVYWLCKRTDHRNISHFQTVPHSPASTHPILGNNNWHFKNNSFLISCFGIFWTLSMTRKFRNYMTIYFLKYNILTGSLKKKVFNIYSCYLLENSKNNNNCSPFF